MNQEELCSLITLYDQLISVCAIIAWRWRSALPQPHFYDHHDHGLYEDDGVDQMLRDDDHHGQRLRDDGEKLVVSRSKIPWEPVSILYSPPPFIVMVMILVVVNTIISTIIFDDSFDFDRTLSTTPPRGGASVVPRVHYRIPKQNQIQIPEVRDSLPEAARDARTGSSSAFRH